MCIRVLEADNRNAVGFKPGRLSTLTMLNVDPASSRPSVEKGLLLDLVPAAFMMVENGPDKRPLPGFVQVVAEQKSHIGRGAIPYGTTPIGINARKLHADNGAAALLDAPRLHELKIQGNAGAIGPAKKLRRRGFGFFLFLLYREPAPLVLPFRKHV